MADFIAHTVRLDLDKTYLRSEFDTMADLLKSAMESPSDKQAFPGAPALLRSLKQNDGLRICIVSGSPTQMRQVLAAKLALDGIDYDEFVLKNNLRNIVRGRFRALRAQVPYKLPTLLASRVATNVVVPETLFGDDAEADAMVYALYADVLAGNLPRDPSWRNHGCGSPSHSNTDAAVNDSRVARTWRSWTSTPGLARSSAATTSPFPRTDPRS